MSELEAQNTHLQRSTKRCSRRRGQWSIGAPGGAGTDDGCRLGVVSEFGRRIDADHLLGTCALLTVWLYVKEQAQTVLAFLFHCVPSLVEDDSSAPFDG